MILDVGPATAEHLARRLADCATLVWNGPLGAFEIPPFDAATNSVAQAEAKPPQPGKLLAVAAGRDTEAALVHAAGLDAFSSVPTATRGFPIWLGGQSHPRVQAL